MSWSFAMFSLVLMSMVGGMLKHFSNFLSYLILVEGACVSLGAMMIQAGSSMPVLGLFVFLVLVASETSMGLGLMVGLMRNAESGVYSLYSQGE
uniref:NADH dehydrogenase subunit 4L n=1 Tax=Ostrea edulis TaxID=37623 RepID=G8DUD2_OSTED|nr:NADH dehydrogenase subunit 4L [Ostrea edulis]ADZ62102.1 NADH dehydrogenase subunit 4L [Ostrea edulis]